MTNGISETEVKHRSGFAIGGLDIAMPVSVAAQNLVGAGPDGHVGGLIVAATGYVLRIASGMAS